MALNSLADANQRLLQPNEPMNSPNDAFSGDGESWSPEDELSKSPQKEYIPPNSEEVVTVVPAHTNSKSVAIEEGQTPSEVDKNLLREGEAIGRYVNAFEAYFNSSPIGSNGIVPSVPATPSVSWEDIWSHVLKAEGGYANNPLDPGGETKFGISKSAYPNLNIASLTTDDAKAIFKVDYFDKVGGDILLRVNPGVAAHVADMAFNAGPKTAINLLYDSAGLPRQDYLTPELIERLSVSDSAVDNYSKARLSYYTGLYNAPTFIKGWVNRVSALNKALGNKSGLGGAYAASRDLDIEYLVQNQYGSYRNAQPRFRDLDSSERGYLTDRERRASSYFDTASSSERAVINDNPNSSIRDVLGASYEAAYYANTRAGLNELVDREARKASELNRQALGDAFQKSTLESITGGLYGGVLSLKDFNRELEYFKKEYPDVKLPVSDAKMVFEAAGKRAQIIEERYSQLEGGSFFDSIGNAAAKLGQVAFGYLPGSILGSISDPYELALMLGTGGQAKTVTEAAKLGAYAFLGAGALQPFVQSKRKELGLESGFTQGLLNATSFGAGTAAFGALSVGLQNLWKLGSKSAAETAGKIANNVDDIMKSQALSPDNLYVSKEAESLRDVAKVYRENPFGHDYASKVLLEKRAVEAASDLSSGKPVRLMKDDIRKFTASDKEVVSAVDKALRASGVDGDLLADRYVKGVKNWNDFKKSQISRIIYQDIDDVPHSMVPITNPKTGDVYTFNTSEDALRFLKKKESEKLISEYAVDVYPDPNGKGYFLGRSADLEPSVAASGRMVGDDVVDDVVNGIRVSGFKGSDDLAIAKRYPEHSRIREFVESKIADSDPTYPKNMAAEEAQNYSKQIDDLLSATRNKLGGDGEERLIKRLEDIEKSYVNTGGKGKAMMDIGDTLGVEERISIRDFIDEIKEERAGLKGMMDCMV